MAARTLPPQEFLREAFDYDPETGLLSWRTDRPETHFQDRHAYGVWRGRCLGRPVGGVSNQGYIRVILNNDHCLAHRVIWKWVTGEEPIEVDHINGCRTDNRWANLRNAPEARIKNRRSRRDNNSGLKGVRYRPGRKFQARIRVGSETIYLGSFDNAEEAHAAYCEAAKKHFGEYWSPG